MNTRLYVGNLSFNTNADGVRTAFEQFGTVTDVHLVTDRETGRARGFAFVTMGSPDEAAKAIQGMDGKTLDGRSLRVNEAEERQQRGGRAMDDTECVPNIRRAHRVRQRANSDHFVHRQLRRRTQLRHGVCHQSF